MSTSNSTVKGKWDEVAGKVKQGVGETFGDDSLANKGTAQQVKGHVEQAWGSVKEGVHDANHTDPNTGAHTTTTRTENDAHDARNSVASAAADVKDHIKAGIDHLKGDR